MIILDSFNNIKKYSSYNYKLLCVRSQGKLTTEDMTKYGLTLVQALSPSGYLFKDWFRWKKGDFTPGENDFIAENDYTFLDNDEISWKFYQRRFLEEMKTRKDMGKSFQRLYDITHVEKQNVVLLCWCSDRTRCHLSLLGLYLEKYYGLEVEYNLVKSRSRFKDNEEKELPF